MLDKISLELTRSLGPSYLVGPVHLGTAEDQTGLLHFFNTSSVLATSFQAGNTTAAITYTWPTAGPAANNYLLASSTTGTLSWLNAAGTFAPIGSAFVTIGNDATLTADRALTGTANQITITDNGANSTVVLSTPQNIHTAATPTFASLTLSATTNQLVLGVTNTITVTAPAPAASRSYTIPDAGASASFVLTAGTQTVTGTKAFTSSTGTGFGAAPSAVTFGGVDIWSGGLALVVGADSGASTRTNATDKLGRFSVPHYTNSEEPVTVAVVTTGTSSNLVVFGGGSGLLNAATALQFNTAANNTTTDGTQRLIIDTNGNVALGTAALATNATNGFLYIPTCAGTPSGTPTTFTGRVPIIFDTSNSKFYVYNGSWLGGTTPGAWV